MRDRDAVSYVLQRTADERERLIGELQAALANIKQLQGLLPLCTWCRKVRNDQNYWQQLESYIAEHTDARFSHGICPECREQLKHAYRRE